MQQHLFLALGEFRCAMNIVSPSQNFKILTSLTRRSAVIANCARLTTVGIADTYGDFVGTVDDKFYFLAALEVVLGISAVSIPALRPLYCHNGGPGSWLRLCRLIRGGSCEGNDDSAGAELGRVRGRNTEGIEKGITVETEFILSSYRTSN